MVVCLYVFGQKDIKTSLFPFIFNEKEGIPRVKHDGIASGDSRWAGSGEFKSISRDLKCV